jgi:sorbitol-6-phosphate 2-dehydrogenase
MKKQEFEGKIALVTGASRGLGQHLAMRLADEGCDLIICDLNLEQLEVTKEQVQQKTASRVIALKVDVTSENDVKRMVETTVAELSTIDLLVCNAALSFSGSIHDISLENWRRIVDVNLFGYFLCVREVSRVMIQNNSGAIVQINSRTGKRGTAKNSAYAASKGGGIVLTQSLSAELAEYNIRVNAVCPGSLFESPLWQEVLFKDYSQRYGLTPDEIKKKYLEVVPLNRGCEYEDVANLVVFLLSDKADYITGQAMNVTGGEVVW